MACEFHQMVFCNSRLFIIWSIGFLSIRHSVVWMRGNTSIHLYSFTQWMKLFPLLKDDLSGVCDLWISSKFQIGIFCLRSSNNGVWIGNAICWKIFLMMLLCNFCKVSKWCSLHPSFSAINRVSNWRIIKLSCCSNPRMSWNGFTFVLFFIFCEIKSGCALQNVPKGLICMICEFHHIVGQFFFSGFFLCFVEWIVPCDLIFMISDFHLREVVSFGWSLFCAAKGSCLKFKSNPLDLNFNKWFEKFQLLGSLVL